MARRKTLVTYLAAYFFVIAVAFRGLNRYQGLPSLWTVTYLFVAFSLLFVIEPWLSRRFHWFTHLYLAAQTGITTAILFTRPYFDYSANLFVSLVFQAMHVFPSRTGFRWASVFTVITTIWLFYGFGWSEGLPFVLTYTVSYFGIGFLFAVARQAETAREEADIAHQESQERLAELEDAHRQLQVFTEQFRLINRVGWYMISILDIGELLDQIARMIQETFDYDPVEFGLVDGDEVAVRISTRQPGDIVRLKIGEGITGWVASTGELLLAPDVSKNPHYIRLGDSKTRSELAVPIKAKGKTIGVLNVESEQLDAFDENDIMVLQSLANQAAVAIENARLHKQAQELAVVKERQRLARDLHDSVTQSLYSLTLFTEAARHMAEELGDERVERHIGQIGKTALQALKKEDDQVELEIVDDGIGFDLKAVRDRGGMGLESIRERVERLGGTTTIRSAPGEGTSVKVTVELDLEEDSHE